MAWRILDQANGRIGRNGFPPSRSGRVANGGFGRASFSVTFTGLSTDSLGLYGQVGGHASIGFATAPSATNDEVKWSASPVAAAAATFGTGNNPTDFAAADGFRVYLHVRRGTEWVTRSFTARRAPGAFEAAPAALLVENGGPVDVVFAAATGTGLTWTYSLVAPPDGITIVSATRTVTFDTNVLPPEAGVYSLRATDQYGRTITRAGVFTFGDIPVLAITSAGEQSGTGSVPIGYTIDRDDPNVRAVIFAASAPPPVAADFFNNSSTYIYQGVVALTASGSDIDIDVVGEFSEPVRLALLPSGGGDAAVALSDAFLLDTAPPGLASTSPGRGDVRVPVDARLTMVFSEAMKRQGTVSLRNVGGALIESFDLSTAGTWSSGDTVWSEKPTADFTEGADLCVRWSGLEDLKGNALEDNTGDTAWAFEVGQWVISGTVIVDSPNASLPIFTGTVIVIG